MSMTYNSFTNLLSNQLVVPSADANFQTQLPQIISDAELRLYRELDLLDSSQLATGTMTAGNRTFTLPSTNGTFIVAETINVITPAGTEPGAGTRNSLVPSSQAYIDFSWPSVNGSTVPQHFTMFNQDTIQVGPWPAANYIVEVIGTIRPNALSSTVTTTILTEFFPDLFFAASMVFAAGYLKNYGAMADDPKMAMSWEKHYQDLLPAAKAEEARKKAVTVIRGSTKA